MGAGVADHPRILVLDGPGRPVQAVQELCQANWDVVRVDTLPRALALMRDERFDGFLANPNDPALRQGTGDLLQAGRILDTLTDGVALIGADLRILWANRAFESWCGGSAVGRDFYEALGSPQMLGPDYAPLHAALAGKHVGTRLHTLNDRYLDLGMTPVLNAAGSVTQLIGQGRDVTAEVVQQQKLEALHKAGVELAALSMEQVAEMSVAERIELLKMNIRRFTHDLLHYDVVEIRLLDRQTGRLEPLLEEGMTQEARERVLYAEAKGNGVTGYVAATGKSHLCPDTARDEHYIEGASGAHSSLTVPISYLDQVIGTFNVESPKVNAFTPDDQQFAEIFSREIASALHTFELLSAEKRSAASQSIEAIGREVALPVDDILASATCVLDRYIGHDEDMADKLRKILAGARAIKNSIQKVGEGLAPAGPACAPGETTHPRLKGLRVLVADNDDRVRRSAHSILGRWGSVVETARDAQEAMTMARLSTYDVILSDIRLPDLSGYEVYRKLREAQPDARVVLMTAYGYDPSHSIVKARQDGLRHILYKPFRIDQLLDALENNEAPTPQSASPAVARV